MVSRTKKYLVLGAVVAFGFASEQALAETVNTNFQVLARVNANCLHQTASDIDHGVYDPLAAADDDAAGAISVACTNGTSYTVGLDVGDGGGDYTTRTLDGACAKLNFNLYRNAGRSEVWGDGTGGSHLVSGIGAGLGIPQSQSHDVYSRIPKEQFLAVPGSYSSTIEVTITY
jgi:spore coat protein U-like protein